MKTLTANKNLTFYKDFRIQKNYRIIRTKDESKIEITGIKILDLDNGKEYEFNKAYEVDWKLYNHGNIKCIRLKDNKVKLVDFNVPVKFKELAKGYKK